MPFPKWSIALRFSPTAFFAGLAILALAAILISRPTPAAAYELAGTYQLISSSTKHLETGQTVPEENAKGFIMYGADGRMLALITYGNRPKAESSAKLTDDQRIQLFRTMLAYGGTYEFDGKTMTHHVDICADEVRCGTTLVRDVTVDGDRLVYTTRPQPSPVDGKMIVITLVWQKLR
jgi:Lipocalin-like domain